MDVIRDSEYLLKAIERDEQVQAKIRTRLVEASQKKKPGVFCPPDCMVDADDCENCLACQKLLEEYLVKAEKMEQSVNQPQSQAMPQKEKPTKCSLCGAPLSNGESECPYCGTTYDFLQKSDPDVPMSKDAFLDELNKITQAMFYTKIVIMQAEYSGYMDLFVELSEMGFLDSMQNRNLQLQGLQFSGGELLEEAQRRQMSCAEYMRALMKGTLQSFKYADVVERMQKNAEIQREADQKIHENRMNELRRIGEIRIKNAPTYLAGGGGGGGTRQCCGNCSNYMPGAARCALNPDSSYQVNASGFCGSYRSK